MSPSRLGRSEKGLLVLAAAALALGVAAWVTDAGQRVPLASAALPPAQTQDQVSFGDRFLGAPSRAGQAVGSTLQRLDRTALSNIEGNLWDAKALLARQLMYGNWRTASVEDIHPSVDDSKQVADDTRAAAAPTGVPMPRPRPVMADIEPQATQAVALADTAPKADTKPEGRTFMDKVSNLFAGKVTLASLTTDGGMFREGPDLASLGYDHRTAVYDISAHAVYLPNGSVFEAHSGIGSLRDDPDHVDRRMVGATPPASYDLKPRESLFHGVAALRMTPADGNTIFGRSGLLVHPFMLGPLGDSNGCVSIRDYDRFLKAYNNGDFNRMVVVPNLSSATAASQRPASPSSSSPS